MIINNNHDNKISFEENISNCCDDPNLLPSLGLAKSNSLDDFSKGSKVDVKTPIREVQLAVTDMRFYENKILRQCQSNEQDNEFCEIDQIFSIALSDDYEKIMKDDVCEEMVVEVLNEEEVVTEEMVEELDLQTDSQLLNNPSVKLAEVMVDGLSLGCEDSLFIK